MQQIVDQQVYQKLVSVFREHPGNISLAAESVGVTWRTAKRAWERGWSQRKLPPIQALLLEESISARSQLEEERVRQAIEEQKEREEARQQAIDVRKQEGLLTGLSRAQSLENLNAAVELSMAARTLVSTLRETINIEAHKLDLWNKYETDILNGHTPQPPTVDKSPLNVKTLAFFLGKVAQINDKIVNTAHRAMEMERLYMGQPTEIIGIVDSTREVSVEELEIKHQAALKAIERAKERGGLRVIDGGQSMPIIGKRVAGNEG